ncbi:MAG: hypothetical protein CM1200mP2_13740 [Planctomycetaceae bacterium]|nr:MAG: hypothetical protein CM1200mP2_13740 [Planctomycetaceae bacterium]
MGTPGARWSPIIRDSFPRTGRPLDPKGRALSAESLHPQFRLFHRRSWRPWKVYSLPTLFYAPPKWAIIPGTTHGVHALLKPAAEKHWRNYCTEVARAYTEQYPDRKENIYQITWEPQGAENGDERLIRTYEIAHKALHAADPKPLVIGPASRDHPERGLGRTCSPQRARKIPGRICGSSLRVQARQ